MKKRYLAVLLVSGMLFVSVFSFTKVFFDHSAGSDQPVPSQYIPTMYIPSHVDENGNKIEDVFEEEIQQKISEGNGTQLARVVVLLNATPVFIHTLIFMQNNGTVKYGPWQNALYGFGGGIPYVLISKFASKCPNLLLVQKDHECEAFMAYAAQQGRARTYVWDTLGYKGDPQSSIAISDTGIDDTHPTHEGYGDADFTRKIVGWRDDVGTGTTPYDDNGHGSHCAGIGAGEGFFTTDADGRAVATWSARFPSGSDPGNYIVTGFNTTRTGTIALDVSASRSTTVRLWYAGYSGDTGTWVEVASGSVPWWGGSTTITYTVDSAHIGYYHITVYLRSSSINVAVVIHWPYDPPSDGYETWTGVAPQARLVGLKGLDNTGSGHSSDLVAGIDWAVANRQKYHILVLSMSWGGTSYSADIDNAVTNAINSGIVCVAAAGNSGSGGNYIHSPGSNPYAISVAATSCSDSITSYSSQGGSSESVSSVVKPDISAPGGSFFLLPIFSTDSNDQDAEDYYTDFYSNDSAPMQGTSMSTPFVAGCADIVAQTMGGYANWNYSGRMALLVKMFLLMTATETYPLSRERGSTSTSPSLDRGDKDVHEGYGRINLDAAVEAVTLTYRLGDVATGSFGSSPLDRKCWARSVYLHDGTDYKFNLTVPAEADYDLYLYNTTGNAYGEPVILAKSTKEMVGGFENITYTPTLSGTYYVVVKRAREDTGTGQFTLTSSPRQAVHLLLTVEPNQATYTEGQTVTFRVDVFNQLNPTLESTLTLTVTGPSDYYYFDFQRISVAADTVSEYSFGWDIPEVAGTYVVEVCLISPQLTAYDAVWLEVA